MKRFNTTGLCIPEKHYMADISGKIKEISEMVDNGLYFTVNRPRQFGKTTVLNALYNELIPEYYVAEMSFEGVGDSFFSNESSFCKSIWNKMTEKFLLSESENLHEILADSDFYPENFIELGSSVKNLCQKSDRPVVLIIDEVDKSSDNQIFLNFLGMLRDKFLESARGRDCTFRSVILAGVYDIKNLKLRLRNDEEKKYNSPWNIAADFDIDMSLSPKEIAGMLKEYEADYNTGMNILSISEEIYRFTSGYPYLVSRICEIIHKKSDAVWTPESVRESVKTILREKNSLFDDMIKNIESNGDFSSILDRILFSGEKIPFDAYNSGINLGEMFGILTCCSETGEETVKISNLIFERRIYDYLTVKKITEDRNMMVEERSQFIDNGRLNMEKVLLKFQNLMKCEYCSEDDSFIERHGRLLFLCFLKPIINGTGFYYIEPETRNRNRMDIVVSYGGEEFIVELKIWHGKSMHDDAFEQLAGYMGNRNQKSGYLLTFSFLKDREYKSEWLDIPGGNRIFDVIV